ncbi:MAG: hypothetical protein BroJett012_09660 [Betaproteobacteria bacterium]|nr:MAG: hypothetical protein BroJett012_09660 [Betaproteobacteria bacterium]
MATPPASDEQTNGPDNGSEAAAPAAGPFNALTDDLNDLRIQHQHCWLWPQISLEIDRLDDVLKDGRHLLEPLAIDCPDWAIKACAGIARSNPAIHQHVERYDSYAQAARSLWTTFIPATPPTLTDTQIYAVMAMHEARMAAEVYCEIAAGIEEEMTQAGVGHDDGDEIVDLRCDIAGWERWHWHYAAQQTGTAERFLLMSSFAATAPDSSAIKKAESQVATLERKARAARAEIAPYRQGRQKGAVNNLTRALQEIVRAARSKEIDAVLDKINEYMGEDIQGRIRFDGFGQYDGRLEYTDLTKNRVDSIAIDSLKRRLRDLPDV